MNDDKNLYLILELQQILDSMRLKENNNRSQLLSEKMAQILESIPEFIEYLNEDNLTLRHKFFIEFGRYIKYNKIQKGTTILHVCEGDKLFYLVITGKLLKLNIRYKYIYSSLKEFILFLAKLYILNEKALYNDCIKKNQGIFPIKENIDLIKYASKIQFFDFKTELKKIKNMKEEILFNNYNEEKIKKKLNISDILFLYNPDIDLDSKNHFLNEDMKFFGSFTVFLC